MLIDVHVHYGYFFFPIHFSNADAIISIMDRFGIDLSLVSNARGIFYDFRDCNSEQFADIEKYPDRMRGYVVLNPNYPESSLEELEKYRTHKQFVGVKLHASWHNKPIDGKEFDVIFSRCDELGIPVLIHSYVVDDFSDQVSSPERIANVGRRYRNKIVLAHMGGNSRRTFRAIEGIDNIFVDISSGRERASQLYVWELERVSQAMDALGEDRVLFGSDFPLLDPSICLGMMEDANLSPAVREKINWKNADKLFRLRNE